MIQFNKKQRDGWRETIEQGIAAARTYRQLTRGVGTQAESSSHTASNRYTFRFMGHLPFRSP